jgi:alpha-mannosidase
MDAPAMVLVPHTHWDREWYLPFAEFQRRLVDMMDGLIELLDDDPRFTHFHLDGQATVIDDYLAVRPEREGDIRRLASDGRISVGPWYTQMDEFLVSGESLIRNLEWGMERARELGAARPVAGYLPDQFGHVGQMPQILRRAGLERAVVWRGVPASIDRSAFVWESPDGSRVLTEYLAFGYGLGGLMVQAEDADALATHLRKAVELLAPLSTRSRLLVPVGGDHQVPARKLAPLLEEAGRSAGVDARIGSIADSLEGLTSENPPTWRGELRSAARAHLLPNVYSARVHQKRARARVEGLLERYAEPLAALVPGAEWPDPDLAEAWRLLLWNGAHDSVCGCSVDEVARDVDQRHASARKLAQRIADGALATLAGKIRRRGWLRFNPSPFERDGVPGLGWSILPEDHHGRPELPVDLRVSAGRIDVAGVTVRFVDEDDVGDLYSFCPAEEGSPIEPTSLRTREGGIRARFPAVQVRLRAFVRPDEPWVRLEGWIGNERPDHRLRLHVLLPEAASGSTAVSPFELVDRPLVSEGGTELPSATWPARGAVLAGGMAVLAEGVFEYEVYRGVEIAITLLRSVGTISRREIATRGWAAGPDIPTPAAQMVGVTRFSLAVYPGARRQDLLPAWERFALPHLTASAPGGGELPDSGSLLEIHGAELSSVRRVGGEIEVRVWNPSSEPREADVGGRAVHLGPARVETVRLGGR